MQIYRAANQQSIINLIEKILLLFFFNHNNINLIHSNHENRTINKAFYHSYQKFQTKYPSPVTIMNFSINNSESSTAICAARPINEFVLLFNA